ncbi:MAG TPA: chemotaxis protein CheW [Chryseolinea sp.]|nr:chemotaxis protein CheW [Chryseolinea sp.]
MKNETPCLLFSLNKELFGINVDNVLRVISLQKLMKVPKAPAYIAGAISLEGNVIPVIDLAKKIELGVTRIDKHTKVVILEVQHNDDILEVGALVDDVLNVITIQESKLMPAAMDRMGFDTQTLDGMYKIDNDFYMILNAEKVFEKELATFTQ